MGLYLLFSEHLGNASEEFVFDQKPGNSSSHRIEASQTEGSLAVVQASLSFWDINPSVSLSPALCCIDGVSTKRIFAVC